MKNLLAPVLSCVILLLAGTVVQAQQAKCINGVNPITGERCANAVTSAVPFLRITPDARGGAMGDVGVATSADPNGMHYNQSKLAFADKNVAISATYTPWMRNLGLTDVYLAYLSGYVKLDKFQAIGFGLRYFSLGSIDFTDENGQSLGSGNPNEWELTGAYSRKLSDKFSAAIGAKFIYSNLATGRVVEGNEIKPGIAGAADISMTYKTPLKIISQKSDLTIGLAITNLGSKITYTNSVNRDFLPTNMGLGFAWRVNLDQYNTFTITSDLNKLLVPTPRPEIDEDANGRPDYKELSPVRGVFTSFSDAPGGLSEEWKEVTKSIGLEYWYDDQFAIRAGYFYENYSKGNRKYLSVGLGVKYSIFGLNFSYLVPTTNNRNPLDNTLRFSLLFDFDALNADE
jgi:opacity protein-like surface antigen